MRSQEEQEDFRIRKKTHIVRYIFILLIILMIPGLSQSMVTRTYSLDVPEIENSLRIVLITDLHSNPFGTKQEILLDAVRAQDPDLVLLGGDIFDERMDVSAARDALEGLKDFPCYYVYGNHECLRSEEDFLEYRRIVQEYGVEILSGETKELVIHGEEINLCGVDDPIVYPFPPEEGEEERLRFETQLERVQAQADNGNYTILLSHRPERFEEYVEGGFDLVLSGHAHGGQWRIPYLINGIYAPDQGFLPKYAGGQYEREETTMIVSRGLSRITPPVPRFYNPPELVVVELH